MPRSLGLLPRTLLGLNGFLTAWCLGCCGFEPLVDGSDRAMAAQCAEDAPMGGSAEKTAPQTPLAASDIGSDALDCGCTCQSCIAVSAARFAFQPGAFEAPDRPLTFSDSPIGTAPQPLYPPPKVLPVLA